MLNGRRRTLHLPLNMTVTVNTDIHTHAHTHLILPLPNTGFYGEYHVAHVDDVCSQHAQCEAAITQGCRPPTPAQNKYYTAALDTPQDTAMNPVTILPRSPETIDTATGQELHPGSRYRTQQAQCRYRATVGRCVPLGKTLTRLGAKSVFGVRI